MKEASKSFIDVQKLYAQQGDRLFRNLYVRERKPFVKWAEKSFNCAPEKAKEIFHDSLTIFYTKVATKEVTTLRSSMKTYLYGIGRNLLLRSYREKGPTVDIDEFDIIQEEEDKIDEEILNSMLTALDELNEGCIRLLTLFYFRNYAIDAIAAEMGIDSMDVVRTKKYKCLQQLKKKFYARINTKK